jgi:hypothetical protein
MRLWGWRYIGQSESGVGRGVDAPLAEDESCEGIVTKVEMAVEIEVLS